MFPVIPSDAIEYVRQVFATANFRAARALSRQPAMHEEALDQQIIAAIDEAGSRIMPGSGAAVAIETHFLGGRRHFENWEIADIALAVIVQRSGHVAVRKVALLQSKRLYSREIPVREEDHADYVIGISRLINRSENAVSLTKARSFSFTEDCVYAQIASGSQQSQTIDTYVAKRNIPVYYSLYNPLVIPLSSSVPQIEDDVGALTPTLGCRVLRHSEVHQVLSTLPVGQRPRFSDLKRPSLSSEDPFASHGWRLEEFVADEVLKCREGRVFERSDDDDLYQLLGGRSGPISAAIVITIDLPEGE